MGVVVTFARRTTCIMDILYLPERLSSAAHGKSQPFLSVVLNLYRVLFSGQFTMTPPSTQTHLPSTPLASSTLTGKRSEQKRRRSEAITYLVLAVGRFLGLFFFPVSKRTIYLLECALALRCLTMPSSFSQPASSGRSICDPYEINMVWKLFLLLIPCNFRQAEKLRKLPNTNLPE